VFARSITGVVVVATTLRRLPTGAHLIRRRRIMAAVQVILQPEQIIRILQDRCISKRAARSRPRVIARRARRQAMRIARRTEALLRRKMR
jgi:hypothetical protein